jgi:hypothetical protein
MSEININPTLLMMYKKKSDNSISDNKTKDTSINDSPVKKVTKRVSFSHSLVEYKDIECYKKYFNDIVIAESVERKETINCHCMVF